MLWASGELKFPKGPRHPGALLHAWRLGKTMRSRAGGPNSTERSTTNAAQVGPGSFANPTQNPRHPIPHNRSANVLGETWGLQVLPAFWQCPSTPRVACTASNFEAVGQQRAGRANGLRLSLRTRNRRIFPLRLQPPTRLPQAKLETPTCRM
jgi:hypothetical protein